MKYIPLDAVIAEIENRIKAIPRGETDKRLKAVYGNEAFVLNDLLSVINTLEVKEVDIDAMVVEYHNALISQDKHHLLTTNAIKGHCEVYRKGLQDMYSLIKGE